MVNEVTAPMPGTIIEISVGEGDEVEEGGVLMILETMKMENNIIAPASGKITEISVDKGNKVDEGALLLKIE